MASKMRSAMQGQTLRAFKVSEHGRIHLTFDGATFLHRDYPQPGDSRSITGTPAYLGDIPERENYCYACLRDNGPKAEIMGALGWVPIRDPKMAKTTRDGALKSGEPTPMRLTSAAKSPKRAPKPAAQSESGPSRETVLARIAERLNALTAEQTELVAMLRSLDALPAPEPERAETPTPKRTGKPRDGEAGAASDDAVVQAALGAWKASAGKPKSDRNSAAYRALCAARPGMDRPTRDGLWDTFTATRSA